MSDKCGNCDCADKSQCVKGNSYGVVIVDSESQPLRAPREEVTAENDGCKCGANCACGSNCSCGK